MHFLMAFALRMLLRMAVAIVRAPLMVQRKAQASNRSSTPKVSKEQPPADDSLVNPTTVQKHPKANMALDFAATYKVLVLGDSNVGKTCIVHRYCDERYYDTYISTIGETRRRKPFLLRLYRIYASTPKD